MSDEIAPDKVGCRGHCRDLDNGVCMLGEGEYPGQIRELACLAEFTQPLCDFVGVGRMQVGFRVVGVHAILRSSSMRSRILAAFSNSSLFAASRISFSSLVIIC